jgi:transposase
MERIDARKLTVEGRDVLRRMVMRLRSQTEMTVPELADVAGVHAKTVEVWITRHRRDGETGLTEKPRGRPIGSGRKLTFVDEVWIREHIISKTPDQLTLPFALWSRPAIKAMILERFEIDMQDRLVGKYLKRWGFTPQRPIKRALEQNPAKIEAWLRETYPEVEARAKAEGGRIMWGDETAVKEDAHWVRGFSPPGKTPVLKLRARWTKLSMISAISARGEITFRIVEDTINAERFIAFLAGLIQHADRKIFLIVDNLTAHHAKLVKTWMTGREHQIELVFLPPYAPESNPDEYLNRDFKTALRSGPVSHNKADLLKKAYAFMERIREMPEHVMSYFRHPSARYAAQGI